MTLPAFRRLPRLLPDDQGSAGLMPWIVATLAFMAILSSAVALSVSDALASWQDEVEASFTIELPPRPQAGADPTPTGAVRDWLRRQPGIESAQVLAPARIAALLQGWLGEGGDAAEVPLPRLIDVLTVPEFAGKPGLTAALGERWPQAVLVDHGAQLAELGRLARGLQALCLLGAALCLAALSLAVVFASRAVLAAHRETVDVLHVIGARDGDVAGQVSRQAFGYTLRGGLMGFALAAFAFAGLRALRDGLETTILAGFSLSALDFALLALVPLLAAALAAGTSHMATLRRLSVLP